MPDPSIFHDMDTAARRIAAAIEAGERIVVFGDYDVDGATSAALLIRLLRATGAEAGYYIPDRLMEGYGPSAEALVRLGREGAGLIVTVDRSEEHTSELQSLMRISYAVFCLKKKKNNNKQTSHTRRY